MYEYEKKLYKEGFSYIVGCDEVGRGPMAGPLVAAAVALPKNPIIQGLNDSKQLSAKKREQLYEKIMELALEVVVEFVDVEEVDRINVYQASKKGMERCLNRIRGQFDFVLSDAMPLDIKVPYNAIIKGDQKSASIAAASIIAKVERDRYMEYMDEIYPEYGFRFHKGYVTPKHLAALKKYGPTPIHRRSFEPVKQLEYEQMSFKI